MDRMVDHFSELGWTYIDIDTDEILKDLKESPCIYTDYAHTNRRCDILNVSDDTKQMIYTKIEPLASYIPEGITISLIQRFPLSHRCGPQRLHRDHDSGPRKAMTLAISDLPLNTIVYSRSHLSENDDRTNYEREKLAYKTVVYDPYILHHSPCIIWRK